MDAFTWGKRKMDTVGERGLKTQINLRIELISSSARVQRG